MSNQLASWQLPISIHLHRYDWQCRASLAHIHIFGNKMQQQQNNKNKDILRGMPESAADSQE